MYVYIGFYYMNFSLKLVLSYLWTVAYNQKIQRES